MDSEKFKKALRIAVNVGCGFEGDAEDAASLLGLIEANEARIAKLEGKLAELIEVGDKMRDLIEQDYDGYLDETIDWRGMAEEADDVLQEREE